MDARTDRELTKLAARAAKLTTMWSEPFGRYERFDLEKYAGPWDPLNDDGDALRLAVYLDLFGTPDFNHYLSVLSFIRGYDKYEIMRRAIVLAAAKIGEGV